MPFSCVAGHVCLLLVCRRMLMLSSLQRERVLSSHAFLSFVLSSLARPMRTFACRCGNTNMLQQKHARLRMGISDVCGISLPLNSTSCPRLCCHSVVLSAYTIHCDDTVDMLVCNGAWVPTLVVLARWSWWLTLMLLTHTQPRWPDIDAFDTQPRWPW